MRDLRLRCAAPLNLCGSHLCAPPTSSVGRSSSQLSDMNGPSLFAPLGPRRRWPACSSGGREQTRAGGLESAASTRKARVSRKGRWQTFNGNKNQSPRVSVMNCRFPAFPQRPAGRRRFRHGNSMNPHWAPRDLRRRRRRRWLAKRIAGANVAPKNGARPTGSMSNQSNAPVGREGARG